MVIIYVRLGKLVFSGFFFNDDICILGGGFLDIDLFFNNGFLGGILYLGIWKVS